MGEQAEPTWMTDEIRTLLGAIGGDHVGKKQTTAIEVGNAKANDTPLTKVFWTEEHTPRPELCHETVWWRSWSKKPEIVAVVEAVKKRVLEWKAETRATQISKYLAEMKLETAKYASQMPVALASVAASPTQKGSDRINAAVTLMKLANPEETASVGTVASVEQSQVLMQLGRFEDALKRAYGGDETEGAAEPE